MLFDIDLLAFGSVTDHPAVTRLSACSRAVARGHSHDYWKSRCYQLAHCSCNHELLHSITQYAGADVKYNPAACPVHEVVSQGCACVSAVNLCIMNVCWLQLTTDGTK